MHQIDTQFYPGWTRKAITFSIDDGIVPMDQKFIEIVRPVGIKGTFNLCKDLKLFAEQYGNRPRDYYYATVGEIVDYVDALKKLIISKNAISNPTELDLYVRVDGKNVIIKAGMVYVEQ